MVSSQHGCRCFNTRSSLIWHGMRLADHHMLHCIHVDSSQAVALQVCLLELVCTALAGGPLLTHLLLTCLPLFPTTLHLPPLTYPHSLYMMSHTLQGRADYHGFHVNLAARLMSASGPGQVATSIETAEHVFRWDSTVHTTPASNHNTSQSACKQPRMHVR